MQKIPLKQPKLATFYKKVNIIKKNKPIKPLPKIISLFQQEKCLQVKFPKHRRTPLNSRLKPSQKALIPGASKMKVGRPPADEMSKEKLIQKYKKLFKWLIISDNQSWCRYCQSYAKLHKMPRFNRKNDNILIFDGSSRLKRDILNKHVNRDIHKKAILDFGDENEKLSLIEKIQKAEGTDLNSMLDTLRKAQPNPALFAQFKTVYFIAKHDLPISMIPNIYSLFSSIGLENISHYKDHHDIAEMLGYISDQVRNEIIKELSSCNSIGISVDESTNIKNQKVLIIHAKYFHYMQRKNKILSVLEVQMATLQLYMRLLEQL